jgi:hypothetical protein
VPHFVDNFSITSQQLPLEPYCFSNPKCYRQIINLMGAGADAAAGQRPALCGGSFAASFPDSYRDSFFFIKKKEQSVLNELRSGD